MKRDTVLRRSQLVTPAAKSGVIAKALASAADSVVLDLEDAVPADRKAEARSVLARALADATIRVGEVAVRINGLHTDWWLDDMRALCGLPVSSIVIPKVRAPGDVVCIDRVAHQLRQHGLAEVSLQPMIETPDAVLQAMSGRTSRMPTGLSGMRRPARRLVMSANGRSTPRRSTPFMRLSCPRRPSWPKRDASSTPMRHPWRRGSAQYWWRGNSSTRRLSRSCKDDWPWKRPIANNGRKAKGRNAS